MKLKAFDLFSGIGGFRQGIDMACKKSKVNIEWVGWCDFDKYAQQTYRSCFNTKGEQFISDMTDVTGSLSEKTRATKKKLDKIMPKIIDNFQTYLRELRIDDLKGSAGIYRLREELLMRVNAGAAPIKIKDVLFKEMLIQ